MPEKSVKPRHSPVHAVQHADTSGVAGIEETSRPLRSKSILRRAVARAERWVGHENCGAARSEKNLEV